MEDISAISQEDATQECVDQVHLEAPKTTNPLGLHGKQIKDKKDVANLHNDIDEVEDVTEEVLEGIEVVGVEGLAHILD